jgi:large subunit ribosomal protein L17
MKHKIGFNRLDRSAAHRKALHRSMVTSLIRHERITTTKAKALEIRRTAEKLVTRAKVDTIHNRRLISARLYDEGMVAKLFTDVAVRMKDRKGGYTRILKLGFRDGDAAEMVLLEFVDYKFEAAEEKDEKKAKKSADKSESAADGDKKEGAAKKAPAKKAATAKAAKASDAGTETKKAPAKKAAAKKTAEESK